MFGLRVFMLPAVFGSVFGLGVPLGCVCSISSEMPAFCCAVVAWLLLFVGLRVLLVCVWREIVFFFFFGLGGLFGSLVCVRSGVLEFVFEINMPLVCAGVFVCTLLFVGSCVPLVCVPPVCVGVVL